jgi:hypothetical protein
VVSVRVNPAAVVASLRKRSRWRKCPRAAIMGNPVMAVHDCGGTTSAGQGPSCGWKPDIDRLRCAFCRNAATTPLSR